MPVSDTEDQAWELIMQPHPHSAPPIEDVPQQPDRSTNLSAGGSTSSASQGQSQVDDVTKHVVADITKRFADAKRPIVLVDACAGRFGMAKTVRKLVEAAGIRFFESESPRCLW